MERLTGLHAVTVVRFVMWSPTVSRALVRWDDIARKVLHPPQSAFCALGASFVHGQIDERLAYEPGQVSDLLCPRTTGTRRETNRSKVQKMCSQGTSLFVLVILELHQLDTSLDHLAFTVHDTLDY